MMTTRSCRASRDSGRPKDATCVTGLSQSAGIPSVPLSVPQALRLGRYKWRRAYGAIPTSISSRGTNHGATRPPRGVLGRQSPATPIARLHDAPYRALNEARAGVSCATRRQGPRRSALKRRAGSPDESETTYRNPAISITLRPGLRVLPIAGSPLRTRNLQGRDVTLVGVGL
ncbi:hypothetical protein BGZ61DRAFT_94973 [Ilyonectria robusta]|uniref:uncharacterized protein n=1 Tax=Ilyonectria robusta TaxID=1079257 RepID=UPI001E8E2A64|nr:uncharacterized protein BGZ61DRAFT_94973 [Ilyonectria robusta]KAH8736441.1 hypothetical protein BGZ61DRAFT_94973 [Ilyonectria robusta]